MTKPAARAVAIGPTDMIMERRADGTILVRSPHPLDPYPEKLTERLHHWARTTPEATFMAERDGKGGWRRLSYAQALDGARRIGQALLDRGLDQDRPVAILSGNDLNHQLLALGAQYVGIPHAPVSPAYSLVATDYAKLRHVAGLLRPGLIFSATTDPFRQAVQTVAPEGCEWVTGDGAAGTPFADLLATVAGEAVAAANDRVDGDTIVKFLFTSGSTGSPKGVITTQRMLCSNQVMIRTHLAFLKEQTPVIVDWLPWNHTFGGSHNVGIVLYNGGTLYIDDGNPSPAGMEKTVANLREIAPTIYFNVPKGFEALTHYLRDDPKLAETFFSRLNLLFFAGAGMPQHVWDELDTLAVRTIGQRISVVTGLGATESAPSAMFCSPETAASGVIGVPVPGVEAKLVPVDDKLEARFRGPSITPGYWRQPDLTQALFDEEGFYRMGDAIKFIDPDSPEKGFMFDGRIAEDFKLDTGTWVNVGPLRARFIAHFAPYVQDVVIAGRDRDAVTALVFPDLIRCRDLAPDLPDGANNAALVAHESVRGEFARRLKAFADGATGSSNRIIRLLLLDAPPGIDSSEMTDKGSINQRAVLDNRPHLVDELYARPRPDRVIAIDT